MTTFNVLKPNTYTDSEGEEQTSFFKVGTAVKHSSGKGYNLYIPDGINVSGELVLLPPKPVSED